MISNHRSNHGGHKGIHSIHGGHIQDGVHIHSIHRQHQQRAQHQRTSCHSNVHSGGHKGIHSIHGGHSQEHVHIHSDHKGIRHQQMLQPRQQQRRTCTGRQWQWISSFCCL